jgi:hypothetical protein
MNFGSKRESLTAEIRNFIIRHRNCKKQTNYAIEDEDRAIADGGAGHDSRRPGFARLSSACSSAFGTPILSGALRNDEDGTVLTTATLGSQPQRVEIG